MKLLQIHPSDTVAVAVEAIEAANYGTAKELLIRAQQDAEEQYLEDA